MDNTTHVQCVLPQLLEAIFQDHFEEVYRRSSKKMFPEMSSLTLGTFPYDKLRVRRRYTPLPYVRDLQLTLGSAV
jgi:hypothetical protein